MSNMPDTDLSGLTDEAVENAVIPMAVDRVLARSVTQAINVLNNELGALMQASAEDHGFIEVFQAKGCYFDPQSAQWRKGQPEKQPIN